MKLKKIVLKPLLIERMKKLLNPSDLGRFKKVIEKPPQNSIRCNTLKINPEKLKEKLINKGWKIKQPFKDYPEIMIIEGKFSEKEPIISHIGVGGRGKEGGKNLILLEPGELGNSLEHLLGYYYVQDIASMLSIIALKPNKNEIILDLCASPGSKTTQIAAKVENTGTIIANDLSISRLQILSANLERCGVTNTIITRKDAIKFCEQVKKTGILFDKILLDAPCSGEGTLRSSYRTSLMWNSNTIKSLSKLQKKMFKNAFEILKPQGEIVYSTCTHAPEENEEVVDFALKEFKGKIKIEKINLPLKTRK